MPISIVVAHDQNHVIGDSKTNSIPWNLPPDMQYFRRLTLGHTVIMGYNTWTSIGGQDLEKRTNVVISREHTPLLNRVITFSSLFTALDTLSRDPDDKIFIIGGAQIFGQALRLRCVETIHRTILHLKTQGDIFFPELDPDEWHVKIDSPHEYGTISYSHQILTRF